MIYFIPADKHNFPFFTNKFISVTLDSIPFFTAIPVLILIKETFAMINLSEAEAIKRRAYIMQNIAYWYIAPLTGPSLVLFSLLFGLMPPLIPITSISLCILITIFIYKINISKSKKMMLKTSEI